MVYIKLFLSFFQVGLFSFGGGFAALPLIQDQVVDVNKWLTLAEFTDLITISQMTPGPIAINAATFVGIRIAGVLGAIISTLGCILPSCIIVSLLGWLYFKYKNLPLIERGSWRVASSCCSPYSICRGIHYGSFILGRKWYFFKFVRY